VLSISDEPLKRRDDLGKAHGKIILKQILYKKKGEYGLGPSSLE
jgi:hypothetical protein